MMLAAAGYAEGEGAPPPALVYALDCAEFHCLPHGGGLLDQPAGLVRRMKICRNIYNSFRGMLDAEDKAEWQTRNPGAWSLVQDVWKLKDER
jgi:hypothetical protein